LKKNIPKSSSGFVVGELHFGSLVHPMHQKMRRENASKIPNIREKQQEFVTIHYWWKNL